MNTDQIKIFEARYTSITLFVVSTILVIGIVVLVFKFLNLDPPKILFAPFLIIIMINLYTAIKTPVIAIISDDSLFLKYPIFNKSREFKFRRITEIRNADLSFEFLQKFIDYITIYSLDGNISISKKGVKNFDQLKSLLNEQQKRNA